MDKAYFNWSSGKDSSLALYYAMKSPIITVESLFSVIDSDGNLPMHNVGSHLLKKQADSIGLPLTIFSYCKKWTEKEYRIAMREYVEKFKVQGITTSLFEDIYLEELRNNRISNCEKVGITADFPLWNMSFLEVMNQFIKCGFKAIIVCINNSLLPENFLGKIIDSEFIEAYPKNLDLCGENGEYHSFVFNGPIFKTPVGFKIVNKYNKTHKDLLTNNLQKYCYLKLE